MPKKCRIRRSSENINGQDTKIQTSRTNVRGLMLKITTQKTKKAAYLAAFLLINFSAISADSLLSSDTQELILNLEFLFL